MSARSDIVTFDEGRKIIDSSMVAFFFYFRFVSVASSYIFPLVIIILEVVAPNFSKRYVTARVSSRCVHPLERRV